jgi:protocatechuate 3,4-dioxygenase beta subunit
MRRWYLVVIAVVVLALVVIAWRVTVGHRDAQRAAQGSGSSSGLRRGPAVRVVTGVIAGAIRDDANAPVAAARVCASAQGREPRCTSSDAAGAYELAGLSAVGYEVTAAATGHRPARYLGVGGRPLLVVLGPGERRSGVDLVLRAGAVEIEGTVADINGGPIAHARVRAATEDFGLNDPRHWYPPIETDAAGAFTLWVTPGDVHLEAVADGYAFVEQDAVAPGQTEILLTPEGAISGTVVDAAGTPVADADVHADWVSVHGTTHTDDAGRFRIEGLVPGRYDVIARAAEGYGRTAGSLTVGLGTQIDGITIQLVPAARVSGRVENEAHESCAGAEVTLHEPALDRDIVLEPAADGTLGASGVLPGTYVVRARCPGHYIKEPLARVAVAREDRVGLVWPMTSATTVRGHVRQSDGTPVERATISVKGKAFYDDTESGIDGTYELTRLGPGDYTLTASTASKSRAEVALAITAATPVVEKDLTLDVGAQIRGVVVDTEGAAVPGLEVRAEAPRVRGGLETSGSDGTFTIAMRPGSYTLVAGPDWKHPLNEPVPVVVAAGQTVTARLVVPPQTGTITGTVADDKGAPVGDAYVTATLSNGFFDSLTRLTLNEHPVLTAADGSFALRGLGTGTYSVEAMRRGGGSARVKGIEVGGTVRLVIAATSSVAGTVAYADGSHPETMKVTVREEAADYFLAETFFHTHGAFTLANVHAGNLTFAVTTPDGLGVATATVAPGEDKGGVTITLERSVTVRGRVVEAVTRAPLPGYMLSAKTKRAKLGDVLDADDTARISGPDGRFAILAPRGETEVTAYSSDFLRSGSCNLPVTVTLTGDADIGDLAVALPSASRDDTGYVGFELGKGAAKLEVISVDAQAPAATSGLVVHDVITSISGVTGPLLERCRSTLLQAAPGTSLSIGLLRGATVNVVVAP